MQLTQIISRPNPPGSKTLGSTVLLIKNHYPHGEILRIKEESKTPVFTGMPGKYWMLHRYQCLRICTISVETPGVPGIPDLFIAHDSRPMERKSYVHVTRQSDRIRLDTVQSFCIPPVRIEADSMATLLRYMEHMPTAQITPAPAYNPLGHGQIAAHHSSASQFYHSENHHGVPGPMYHGYAMAPPNPNIPFLWPYEYSLSFGGQYTAQTPQEVSSFQTSEHSAGFDMQYEQQQDGR